MSIEPKVEQTNLKLPIDILFLWRTPCLFKCLIQNILQLPVCASELVRSPFLNRLHHFGIESQNKVFGFLAHGINGSTFLH